MIGDFKNTPFVKFLWRCMLKGDFNNRTKETKELKTFCSIFTQFEGSCRDSKIRVKERKREHPENSPHVARGQKTIS